MSIKRIKTTKAPTQIVGANGAVLHVGAEGALRNQIQVIVELSFLIHEGLSRVLMTEAQKNSLLLFKSFE